VPVLSVCLLFSSERRHGAYDGYRCCIRRPVFHNGFLLSIQNGKKESMPIATLWSAVSVWKPFKAKPISQELNVVIPSTFSVCIGGIGNTQRAHSAGKTLERLKKEE
jgi:hypothetical protein